MKHSKIKRFTRSKSFTILIALIIVVAFFGFANPNYLSGTNITTILNSCSLSGTITVGVAVLLIGGGCDLSVGAVGCMGGLCAAILLNAGVPWWLTIILVIVFGVIAGLINSFFTYVCNIMPFIGTMAMSTVWKGIGNQITDTKNIAIADEMFWKIGSTKIGFLPLPFVIMILLFIIYGFILTYTRAGRNIYIIGGSPSAARLAGLNPKKTGTLLMINASAIAALAGAIYAARMHQASPSSIFGAEIDGITAAVMGGIAFTGGTGGMFGCFIGLMLLNAFSNGFTVMNFNPYWQIFCRGLLLIAALGLDFFRNKARLSKLNSEGHLPDVAQV